MIVNLCYVRPLRSVRGEGCKWQWPSATGGWQPEATTSWQPVGNQLATSWRLVARAKRKSYLPTYGTLRKYPGSCRWSERATMNRAAIEATILFWAGGTSARFAP